MPILDRQLSYADVLGWGALEVCTEDHVRTLFGDKDSVSLRETLDRPIGPHLLFWMIMREELVPPRTMHRLALELAERTIDRLARDGVYIDFRTRSALMAKRRWMEGSIGLGALAAALLQAEQAADDLAGLRDPAVSLAARIARQAADPSAREAFRDAFESATSRYGEEADILALLGAVRSALEEEA